MGSNSIFNGLQAQPLAGLQNPAAGAQGGCPTCATGAACPSCPPSGAGGLGAQSPVFPGLGALGGSPQAGLQSQFANDPLAQIGLQSMSPDTQMLFVTLQTMMVGIMGMIASLLAGILNGSISGTAPPGSGGSAATAAGTGGGTPGSAPGGASGPASNQQPNDQGFVLPLDKQHIDRPSDSGDFGPRSAPTAGASTDHKGNDFGAPEGTPIYAVKSGTIRIKPNNGGAGNTVEIDHGNGLVTKYFHLSAFGNFKDGDRIEQGQVLGNVGTTGTSTGPHLHFEVHQNGSPVDPWPFLQGLV